ncbi:MAG: hypothetical protein P8175_14610 [Deltaproteobacteria bacterium]
MHRRKQVIGLLTPILGLNLKVQNLKREGSRNGGSTLAEIEILDCLGENPISIGPFLGNGIDHPHFKMINTIRNKNSFNISKTFCLRDAPMEVCCAGKELSRPVEAWRERGLAWYRLKYKYMDGTLFSTRIHGPAEKVPVLVKIAGG